MNNEILVFLAGAGGAALIKLIDGVIQFALQRHAKKRDSGEQEKTELEKKVDAIADCLVASTLERIQNLCKTYIKDGEIDIDDRRRLHVMHEKYHAIGGNGDLDELMEQVNRLPLKV